MLQRKTVPLLLVFVIAACGPTIPPTSVPSITQIQPTLTLIPAITPSQRPVIPTATATLVPGPLEFTEDFNGSLPYWSFLQTNGAEPAGIPEITNGSMRFELPELNQWVYEVYEAQEYSDVRIDAKVEFRSGGQVAAGLICHYDEQQGWYELQVLPDQTYVLLFGQWLAEGIAQYIPLVSVESEKITAGENEIGLECKANTLTPYLNGVKMRQRQEKLHILTAGRIGFGASAFEQVLAVIAFDWLKVEVP